MAKIGSVIGSNKAPGPPEARTSQKDWPNYAEYGLKIMQAMDAANLPIKICADKSDLKEGVIKKARAGKHIRPQTHQRILAAIQAALPLAKKHLGNIEYPWVTKEAPPSLQQGESVILKPASFVMVAKPDMPQAAHGRELDLEGGRLSAVKCSIQTSSAYFRFGVKLLPVGIPLCGETTIQSKQDFLVHIGRNDWNGRGWASAKELFLTRYRRGVKEGEDVRLFEVGLLLKAKLEFSIDAGFILRLRINGKQEFETPVLPDLCKRAALFAWNDHHGLLRVRVTDVKVTVLKSAKLG
jgi:hypothetical protein